MSKSIPCGLLVLAVLSPFAQAQEGKSAGGWSVKPGKGLTFDGGEAFSLKWTNRIQAHWTYAANEDYTGNAGLDTNSFNIRRLRTKFAGHVFNKNVLYTIEYDGVDSGSSGDGAVKEAWGQWNFCTGDDHAIGLRMGQGKTQFGLEATGSSGGLFFVERSSASRGFADAYSRGAWLFGQHMDSKLRWSAGAMNTSVASGLANGASSYVDAGEETSNSDNELTYVLTANFDPLGDFFGGKQTCEGFRQGDFRTDDRSFKGTVGIGLEFANGKDTSAAGTDVEGMAYNINTAWSFDGFQVLGEYFAREDDQQGATNSEEPMGWAVSFGYLFKQSGDSAMRWGVGLRVSDVETDDGGDASVDYLTGLQGISVDLGSCREISVVVNAFYHEHACKTQFEVTHQEVDVDGGSGFDRDNLLFRLGFQIEI
jgi:hypothetical protein